MNLRKTMITCLVIAATAAACVFLSAALSRPANAYSGKYWLKINNQANVITAYKRTNGKWKPVRAMLCSTGTGGYGLNGLSYSSPLGTYYTKEKNRWLAMRLNGVSDYAQYTAHVVGGIYIHSVWYYRPTPSAQATAEFNKLGRDASHGCIRVSVADAKWMYDNCPSGTKLTFYNSRKAGPLGKPKAIKVVNRGQYWDPTDPNPKNPYYIMPKPKLKIKRSSVVQFGSKLNLKNHVKAKDPNSFYDLTKYVKVAKKQKLVKGKYKTVKSITTSKKGWHGKYRVKYSVNDPWGKTATKWFYFKITDSSKPTISGAKSVKAEEGYSNAVKGVKAAQKSGSLTSRIKVTVKDPKGHKTVMTFKQAQKFKFKKAGTYKVTYSVVNRYDSSKKKSKTVKFTITKKSEVTPEDPDKQDPTVTPTDPETPTDPQTPTDETPADKTGSANSGTTDTTGTTDKSGTTVKSGTTGTTGTASKPAETAGSSQDTASTESTGK